MQIIFFVIARMIQLLIGFLGTALFLRAILSWFITNEENRFAIFLLAVTEPFILPFRVLCRLMKIPEDFPLDIPFSITMVVVMILNLILPTVTL